MASVSMDDLSKIDADSKLEQELLQETESTTSMEVDSTAVGPSDCPEVVGAAETKPEEKSEEKIEEKSAKKSEEKPQLEKSGTTETVKVEPVDNSTSTTAVSAEKGFQNDTQNGFQNDAQVNNGPNDGVDSDGDVVMAPTVFGAYTMAELTLQNPTESESILIDSFQGSIKLLLEILGIVWI